MTHPARPTSLRIVMPVLNEGSGEDLANSLRALEALRARGAELVVVDGGSTDATWAVASAGADQVRLAPRGRAAQMNAGAQGSDADVLLFLHADTRLPDNADRLVGDALLRGHVWGRFDVRIAGTHPLLRVIARLMNLRSRLTGIATGDQAIFVRRSVFEALGGFADQPLMEDIALSTRLRKSQGPPACLRATVTTSGRRWEQSGVWRTMALMWRLRAAYFFGASASALALRYGYAPRPAPAAAAIAVLAKAPVPGLAKTRLIPALGAAGAARAQRRFTLHTLQTSRAAALGPVRLSCAPDTQHRFFRALQRSGTVCTNQAGGDLGQRMQHVCEQHFARQPDLPLLLIGTDCPLLAPGHLHQAARALYQHDAVLIPAEDGGYVLLGLRRPLPDVFQDIDWSTSQVLAQTRLKLQQCGARWLEMPALWDVDEPADWQRFAALGVRPV